MAATEASDAVSYVVDPSGKRTAVIVPIDLWREIASEIETRYLTDSPAMRQRLLDAIERDRGVGLDDALRELDAEDLRHEAS